MPSLPPPRFTASALALATPRANAVGAVRIDLGPDAIALELRRVAAFREGFAIGSLADPVQLHVPYSSVRGLLTQEGVLYLTFDPSRVTPFNRFALAGFSSTPEGATPHDQVAASFRERERTRRASQVLPLPLGAIAAWLVPSVMAEGAVGRGAVGALVAMGVFVVLRELATTLAIDGPESARIRERFEAELGARLGLVAVPPVVHRPPEAVVAARARRRDEERSRSPIRSRRKVRSERPPPLLPPVPVVAAQAEPERISLATRRGIVALAATTALAVAAIAFMGRRGTTDPRPEVDFAVAGLGPRVSALRASWPAAAEPERCVCVRADSTLWKDGVPRVAVLTFHGEDEASAPLSSTPDRRGAPRFDFDLAIVNDGARPVRDVRLTLTFARRTPAGRRVGAVDRGLFWEGALAPGGSVKWRVTAPGSEVRLDASENGTLEASGTAPAPADAFFKLTSSRFRALRLHGAMMLSYLRDPRAESAIRAIEGGADAPLVESIRRAAAPVIACEVARSEGSATACVFNASSRTKRGLAAREVGKADKIPLGIEVPVHEGRRVTVALPDGGELEIVDGED